MSPEFWGMATITLAGAATGITMAVNEARSVRAQHHAYRAWERTGKAVAGWSERWIWAHDKTPDLPAAGSVVVNVFNTLTSIVNVTQVHRRPVSPSGSISGAQGAPQALTASKVVPGRVLGSGATSGAGDLVGSMAAIARQGRG